MRCESGILKHAFLGGFGFRNPGEINPDLLMDEFRKVCECIEVQSGVRFLQEQHRIEEKFSATDSPMADLKSV